MQKDRQPDKPSPVTGKATNLKRWRLPQGVKRTLRVLRWFLVPFLCVAALFGGLITGYVVLGGGELADVFKMETWRHVYDLVFAS